MLVIRANLACFQDEWYQACVYFTAIRIINVGMTCTIFGDFTRKEPDHDCAASDISEDKESACRTNLRLAVKGRSKMNKAKLERALQR